MEFTESKEFNAYVEKFKQLTLKDKKNFVEEELKELLVVLELLNKKYNKDTKVLFNREIIDLKKDNSSEDDFVEGIFVYINSIKELLATLVEKINL